MSDWTIQATKILSRLDGHRSSRKMRDTIIGIVSAKTEGKTVVQYFASGNPVVSKQGFEKWMLIPEFRAVFEEVESLAYNTMDREALKSLRTARRALTHAAGIAVAELVRIVRSSDDVKIRLSAANSILDRVSFEALKDEEGAGGMERRAIINSDTMAALIAAAMSQRGNLVGDDAGA